MRSDLVTRLALALVAIGAGACHTDVQNAPGTERPDASAEAGTGGGGNIYPESPRPWELHPVVSTPPADEPRADRRDDCDFPADGVVALASTGAAGPIDVDRDYVYFANPRNKDCRIIASNAIACDHEASVQRVPRCGGTVEALGQPFPEAIWRLASGGGNAYVVAGRSEGQSQLFRIAPDGKHELVVDGPCITDVVADETGFVVADMCNNRVASGTHDSTKLHTIATGFKIDHLALGTSNVYFATSEGIRWATRDGRRTGLFTDGPSSAHVKGLGVDGAVLFVEWLGLFPEVSPTFSVARVPFDGSAVETYGPFHQSAHGAPPIDVADGFLRFNALGDMERSIQRVAVKADSEPTAVANREYEDVRGYGDRTYWVENGSLLTVVEPPPRRCYDERPPDSRKTFPAEGPFEFDQAVFDASGNLFVSGYGPTSVDLGRGPVALDSQEKVLAKFDAAGEVSWAVAVPANVYFGLAGQAGVLLVSEQSMSRLSTSGSVEWTVSEPVRGRSVVAGEDGSVYAVEETNTASLPVRMRALSPTGDEIWSRALELPAGLELTGPLSVALSTDTVVAGVGLLSGAKAGEIADPAGDATLVVSFGIAAGDKKWSRLIRGGRGGVAARPGEVLVLGQTMFAVDDGLLQVSVPQAGEPYVFVARYKQNGTPITLKYLDLRQAGAPVFTSDGGFYMSSFGCSTIQTPGATSPGDRIGSNTVVRVSAADEVSWMGIGSYGHGVAVAVGADSVVLATGVDGLDGGATQAALLSFPKR